MHDFIFDIIRKQETIINNYNFFKITELRMHNICVEISWQLSVYFTPEDVI